MMMPFKNTKIQKMIKDLNIKEADLEKALLEYGAKDSLKPTFEECIFTAYDMVLDNFKKAVMHYQEKNCVYRFSCVSEINIEIRTHLLNHGLGGAFVEFNPLDLSDKNIAVFLDTYEKHVA